MAFNVGVNVVEVDGRAAPTITTAPVSITGLLVRSERGIPNLPVRIRGLTDFGANFGGFVSDGAGNPLFGAHVVRAFFDNGGTEAVVSRVVGGGAIAASVQLSNSAPVPVLGVFAGARGQRDPGRWGNALSVQVAEHPRTISPIPAQIVGTGVEPFALTAGQTLLLTVNGGATLTVTFASSDFQAIGAATAAEVAAVIRRATTAVRAAATPQRELLLCSASPGAASRLVVGGTAATELGFTGGTANSDSGLAVGDLHIALESIAALTLGSAVQLETRGHTIAPLSVAASIADGAAITVTPDGGTPVLVTFLAADFVNGVGAITAQEVRDAINRQAQGFTAALTQSGRIAISSNRYGPGSSISVNAPGGVITDATADVGMTADSPVAGVREFHALGAANEAQRFVTLATGLFGPIPPNFARLRSVEFDLVVRRGGVEIERFESLSMQANLDYYVATVLNSASTGSRFVTVVDLGVAGPGTNVPVPGNFGLGQTVPTAGDDGAAPLDPEYVGNPAARTGLFAFDPVRIQLLGCPETTSPGFVSAALGYCESRGDAMFVGATPQGFDLEASKLYAAGFRAKKVYGALYMPWLSIINPLDLTGADPRLLVPPIGHVLGTYARIADTRGAWKAPAGDEALLRNALGVEFDMTDTEETDLVKNGGVNAIRTYPGSGIVIDTSRTLSTDTRWLFVNVRRLFNLVKSSLRDGLRWVAQEPHSEDLRRAVRFNVVTPFLLGLWRQGAFGAGPPEQLFTVKCDAQNNPPSEVNQGNFKLEVYFYPVKPAETIVIVVGQQESEASAAET